MAKKAARARGVMVPEGTAFRYLRGFMDAVLIASGPPARNVQIRMRHSALAMTLDTYGFALEVDRENAPASFEELRLGRRVLTGPARVGVRAVCAVANEGERPSRSGVVALFPAAIRHVW
jgi:hypothetical protein